MTRDEIQAEIDASESAVVSIVELLPADVNPRRNNDASKALARLVLEMGWGAPPLIQKSTSKLIAGHTRVKAAQIVGLERVPVHILDVDDRRAKALQLADNRMGELAGWDFLELGEELSHFSLEEADALGFDAKYLEELADKVDNFGPLDSSANPSLDEVSGGIFGESVTCPSCGTEFNAKKARADKN
jgi:ParB-like chromosome segregation protein Spo0J